MKWFVFFQYRLSMLFLLAFLLLFLRLRKGWAMRLAALLVCLCVTDLVDFQRIIVTDRLHASIIGTLLEIAVVQGAALLLSDYRDFRALFTGVTAAAYVQAGNMLSEMVFLRTQNLVQSLGVELVIDLLALAALLCIRGVYLDAMSLGGRGWGHLTMLPALFYATWYALSVWPTSIYDVPTNTLATLLLLVLMVLLYMLLFSAFFRYQRSVKLRRDYEFLETYAQCLRSAAEERQKRDVELAVFRHDQRHNMNLMAAYLEAGELDKLRELLNHLTAASDGERHAVYCENVAINGILGHYASMAGERQVDFRCRADIPAELHINEFEFAVVVANLMENAILAAAKIPETADRYAAFSVRQVRDKVIVQVVNSYIGNVAIDQETGLPISENGEGHGYGLRSVRSFAEKNGALFSYETSDKPPERDGDAGACDPPAARAAPDVKTFSVRLLVKL